MAIEITHVRYSGLQRHEQAIVRYKWRNTADGTGGDNDKPSLVAWVDGGGDAYVGSGRDRVNVGVVRPNPGQPYLRTYADGSWTNNLTALPTF